MEITKPNIERIIPNPGSSFTVKHFNTPSENNAGKFWHHHPEVELVYVNGGSGKRHIGNHLSYYTGGELVLIGSNLPHSGFSDRLDGGQKETVVQFSPDFLGNTFFNSKEFTDIAELFELSKKGIAFSKKTIEHLGDKIESLIGLKPFYRLLSLLEILHLLARQNDYQILNAEGMAMIIDRQDNDRMRVIFNYVKNNFQENIKLKDVADLVNLTEPSFSRYFRNSTGQTFTEFVNHSRLVHAAKLLAEDDLTIGQVAIESGFNNFSHFNKHFQRQFSQTASEYRKNFREVIS